MARDPVLLRAASSTGRRARSALATGSPIHDLAAALAFLTRLPIPARWLVDDRTGAAAFGLAGAAIGAVAAIPLALFGSTHSGPAAVACLAIVAIVSGGLHLDGLADTADALAAPPGAADRARTDPRAGSAGVVAVVLILLLEAALLTELATPSGWMAGAAVVAAASASRSAATVAGVLADPKRAGGRLGSWFVARLGPADASLAIVATVAVAGVASVATDRSVAIGLIGGSGIALAAGAVIVRLRRRLNGDGFGALIELTFAAVLLAVLAARSVLG